ncbi:MAG: NTP transferase domain-containing protein [Cyanobacteria bacterium]|nr:NTP transferase domain-containing protein [Cyanobacteriota bacterium]
MTQAVILAGGMGTRLRPYTTLLPKALVPLGEMPILEVVLRQLKYYGFTTITLAVGHLAELIEAYFGDGSKLGLHIQYVREDQPMGTAGPLRRIPNLPENFLVMNADIVSDINYREFFDSHVRQKHLTTIAVYQRTSKIDFGIIEYDEETHQIQAFVEKPTLEHSVSMGVYMFNRRIQEFIPENQFYGFDHLMKHLIDVNEASHTFPFKGYWLDIGRVDDYETAVNDFQQMRSHLIPSDSP